MDCGSTTKVDKEVMQMMLPYFDRSYGNASSLHSFGLEALHAIEIARKQVASVIKAKEEEIFFTSGGTESDNLAVKGVAYFKKEKRTTKGPHIITSSIEHPAVLETCKHLERQGFKVAYLPVDEYGIIQIEELEQVISNDTLLVSVMYANNEIGTIEPIKEIGKLTHEYNALFHTDAVQAIGKIPLDVDKSYIDLLSISSHKIYGPKGVGALFVRNGVKLQTISHGGGHEEGLRSGTYNTPGIVGLGKACELAKVRMEHDTTYLKKLRDTLIENILHIDESYLNGHPKKRLANNAHFRFTAIEGESLNLLLDEKGIAAATGSACSSKKLEPSHVLLAIGLSPDKAHGSIRLTLGRDNTEEEIDYVSQVIPEIVDKLRMMSPLWNK
jgi:cysteine desulfurase